MSNPLDGNGVEAWPPRDWQCPECSYRSYCTFDADKGGPGSDLRCLNCKAVFRAPPAPSHTAVEPVAELVERLRDIVTEFDNEVADMMSNDGAERADLWVDVDVPIGIVRQAISTLTAQAAALAKAEGRVEALMAERTSLIATKREQLAAAESEVATLKARIAELEAWKADALEALNPLGEYATTIEGNYAMPLPDNLCPTPAFPLSMFRAARRLTHQEKNNGR